jgi:hypothetical protein
VSVHELSSADLATDGEIHRLIADLVRHGVAVTSTLAVFESFTDDDSVLTRAHPSAGVQGRVSGI